MKTSPSISSTSVDVPVFVLDVLKDYLAGHIDPERDETVRGWSEVRKKEVIQIARMKLFPNKK